MREDIGEQHYSEQYMAALSATLASPCRVLDVGCQYGRFAIPLLEQGHEVVATDPDPACIDYLRGRHSRLELRQETADVTIDRLGSDQFDLVLCLELLYVLPDWQSVLAGLGRLARRDGRVAASHRTQGYYLHRMLREGRYDELDALLAGRHPTLNAQRPDELRSAYADAGLQMEAMTPIGAFSGIHVDPFAAICDPSRLDRRDRQRLSQLETDSRLTERFADSARYVLAVAAPRESAVRA
jgi:2-polyprenyl-3-methyl-5-hydroxy-6-metoxy-1,4-benzoquinol methylase